MPNLMSSLLDRDLGFLRAVAELWNLDLNAPDTRTALSTLVDTLPDPARVVELVEALPAEAQNALARLVENEGRLPVVAFTRQFGAVREMGPGQRDRKKPHRNPDSVTEMLYYRALVGRTFLDTPDGMQEFFFIPDEFIALLPRLESEEQLPPGRPASPLERQQPIPATDHLLDDACTLLAGLRLGWKAEAVPLPPGGMPAGLLQRLLAEAGLLDGQGVPRPEETRAFLEAPRGEALALLVRAWLNSSRFNDLRLTPGLISEGDWQNEPVKARQAVLDWLRRVPAQSWWSIPSLASAIREQQPDFQRPAGDYDSWFIRSAQTGDYLRGFGSWDQVEGALVRFLITAPLHWLGLLDLAAPAPDAEPAAFRLSAWFETLLDGRTPAGFAREDAVLQAASSGVLRLHRLTPRAARYQVARCSAWLGEKGDEYRYRLTPASLDLARKQGLRVSHILTLLRRHNNGPVPVPLAQALERWDQNGAQVRVEPVVLLRVSAPDLLQTLRQSRAARFLGEPLGPTTIVVSTGAVEKLIAVLAELGYLADVSLDALAGGGIIPPGPQD